MQEYTKYLHRWDRQVHPLHVTAPSRPANTCSTAQLAVHPASAVQHAPLTISASSEQRYDTSFATFSISTKIVVSGWTAYRQQVLYGEEKGPTPEDVASPLHDTDLRFRPYVDAGDSQDATVVLGHPPVLLTSPGNVCDVLLE